MKKIIYIVLICLLTPIVVNAQSDGNYEYTKEFIWGFNKNTNGGLLGGFVFKWGKAITEKKFRTIGFELMNVKHPSEFRYPTRSGSQFIWGKSNYLYSVRGLYGFDFLLYKKAPQQGVQINASIAGGPTIGVVAPYFIQYALDPSGDAAVSEQFDAEKHTSINLIIGPGKLFEGLGKSKIRFGLNVKASLSFELGAFKSSLTGFEVGVQFEGFTNKIPLIPTLENRAFFSSAFITFFYGSRK